MNLNTAPAALKEFIAETVDDVKRMLGNELVAVLLHGSLAMGSFYIPKSDIDLLVIADDMPQEVGRRLYDVFARAHQRRPYAGGLEVSVIPRAAAAEPVNPMPYFVHFSETTTGFKPYEDGHLPVDADLIAHLMVAKTRGVNLYGPSPAQVIGEVSWPDYLASVRADIDWILADENILASPCYCVLNLCRWAMMIALPQKQAVSSKEEAAQWALAHPPMPLRRVVEQALLTYRSTDWPRDAAARRLAGGPWSKADLLGFRDWVRARSS